MLCEQVSNRNWYTLLEALKIITASLEMCNGVCLGGPPSILKLWRWLNLALVIGVLPSTGIGTVSAGPTRVGEPGMQHKGGKKVCFSSFCLFTLLLVVAMKGSPSATLP